MFSFWCWRVCLHCCLSFSTSYSPLFVCVCVCVAFGKEYVTVGQLNQMYGMPKVESSPTSPLRQPLQSGAVDPAFSCLSSLHGSSPSLSVEVCAVFLPSIPSFLLFLAAFVYKLSTVVFESCFLKNHINNLQKLVFCCDDSPVWIRLHTESLLRSGYVVWIWDISILWPGIIASPLGQSVRFWKGNNRQLLNSSAVKDITHNRFVNPTWHNIWI